MGSGEAATAHLSASETRVELEEVGVGSNLGQVPLHGALGVSRGVVLLYCCQHTRRIESAYELEIEIAQPARASLLINLGKRMQRTQDAVRIIMICG